MKSRFISCVHITVRPEEVGYLLILNERAEQEVFHDGVFVQHLVLVHLNHTSADFSPGRHSADIIEHW